MSKGREIPCGEALELVQPVLDALGPTARIAGSLRRGKQLVRDVDVVVVEPPDMKALRRAAKRIVEAGEQKVRLKVAKGLQVDILVTVPEHFGGALLALTGPREWNMALRSHAKDMKLKLNEKGVWDGDELVAGDTEPAILEAMGLKFVLPSKRSAAALIPIKIEGQSFQVPSRSNPKAPPYTVTVHDGKPRCHCRGFAFRKDCHHVKVVRELLAKEAA